MGKACSKCGDENPPEGFRKGRTICMACFKEQRKAKDAAYRERHRERVRENGRRWYRDNPEVGKRYYRVNREEILRKSREERAEANKEARLALARRKEERAARQRKYASNRQAVKELADKGLKRCAGCGEDRPFSAYGVVTYSSGNKGPRSKCYDCRCAEWNDAPKEEKVKRSEINNAKHRIRRGGLRIWHPPSLCSVEGCENPRNGGGRMKALKKEGLCAYHFSKKERDELRNNYVICKLRRDFGVKNPPQELIELKRVQLKIHRELNRGATK